MTSDCVHEVFATAAECVCAPPSVGPAIVVTEAAVAALVAAARPGGRHTVVVSDQTRRTGSAEILPPLLAGWRARGVGDRDISFLVACGAHRAPDAEELARILGAEAAARYRDRVRVHDAFAAEVVALGRTRRWTPVAVNRHALDTDVLVPIGGVTFHYFAGYTGGRKSLVPGLAAAETIAANHTLAVDACAGGFRAGVEVGRLDGNPLAEDLEEAAALLPVAATAQTVLDGEGRLVALCCGPLRRAHREACRAAAARFAVPLAARGDLVLADAGPARNWVQSHKALVNAERAAAPGGVIILHAPCPEGLGSASLRHWLERGTPAAILASLPGRADINAQTALSTLLRGRRAILVAPGAPADLALAGMPVAEDLRQALLLARERLPAAALAQPRVVRLPQAWLTVPCPPDLPLPAVAVK